MSTTWWINSEQLDPDQVIAYSGKPEESAIVVGPPGSGKTNLLLLRAAYLERLRHSNFKIVVFTRLLEAFLQLGASTYNVDVNKFTTSQKFIRSLGRQILNEEDFDFESDEDLLTQRRDLAKRILESESLTNHASTYDCILIDEVQDYCAEEIKVFSIIAETIYVVGDENQSIYDVNGAFAQAKELGIREYKLRNHYRNGLEICRLADALARNKLKPVELAEFSKYDELADKSSINIRENLSLEEQVGLVVTEIPSLLQAYPNDFHAIIVPTRNALQRVMQLVEGSSISQYIWDSNTPLTYEKPLIVTTAHSAKGLEFRSVSALAADNFIRFQAKSRALTFTVFTRAKTRLNVFFEEEVAAFIRSAEARASDDETAADPSDVFPV